MLELLYFYTQEKKPIEEIPDENFFQDIYRIYLEKE
jgi:hypothetical protein